MTRLDRRQFLKIAGMGACVIAGATTAVSAQPLVVSPFELPKLPYPVDALEPVIDGKTMEIHHGKHHQGYVNILNAALKGLPNTEFKTLERLLTSLDEVPEEFRTAVRNNGGGHYNHSLFWESMKKPNMEGINRPTGDLAKAVSSTFGSFETFQEKFQEAGGKLFGSGWVWLAWNPDKSTLEVVTTPNQDNPLMTGSLQPLLGNDCWEHAYYLNYQNRRADYLKAWWRVVDWQKVAERLRDLS